MRCLGEYVHQSSCQCPQGDSRRPEPATRQSVHVRKVRVPVAYSFVRSLAAIGFDMPQDHHHRLNRRRDRAPHSRTVHAGRESISRRGEEREQGNEAGQQHSDQLSINEMRTAFSIPRWQSAE